MSGGTRSADGLQLAASAAGAESMYSTYSTAIQLEQAGSLAPSTCTCSILRLQRFVQIFRIRRNDPVATGSAGGVGTPGLGAIVIIVMKGNRMKIATRLTGFL